MKPAFPIFFALLTTNALAEPKGDATALERLFADRYAMQKIDNTCNFFDSSQRRALDAFVIQAKGDLLIKGSSESRIHLIQNQVTAAMAKKSCKDAQVKSEIERTKKAYISWKSQVATNYIGLRKSWQVSRAGIDAWRAWQDLGNGVKAGYVGVKNGLAFAIETPDKNIVSARIYLRNYVLAGKPQINKTIVLCPRSATDIFNANSIYRAISKQRLAGKPREGTLILFSNEIISRINNLDARDYFEIELMYSNNQSKFFVVEAGNVGAAFALAAEY